jgi:hypothetical protein
MTMSTRRNIPAPRTRRGDASIARAAFEALEHRRLLAASAIVFPGATDGRLVYAPDAEGDRIPDFSQVGYKTGNVPLPNTPGGVAVPVKQTVNPRRRRPRHDVDHPSRHQRG